MEFNSFKEYCSMYPDLKLYFFGMGRKKDGLEKKITKFFGVEEISSQNIKHTLNDSLIYCKSHNLRLYVFFQIGEINHKIYKEVEISKFFGNKLVQLDIDDNNFDLNTFFQLKPGYIKDTFIHKTKNGYHIIFLLNSNFFQWTKAHFRDIQKLDIIGWPSIILYYPGDDITVEQIMDKYFN